MTSDSQYGTMGALALVVGGIVFGLAVTFQDVGADPAAIVLGAGIVALVLLAVGILGLLSLQFEVYEEEAI